MSEKENDNVMDDFAAASKQNRTSLGEELAGWLKHNKKWWLLPILLMIFLLGVIVVLGSTGLAPFIYPLF